MKFPAAGRRHFARLCTLFVCRRYINVKSTMFRENAGQSKNIWTKGGRTDQNKKNTVPSCERNKRLGLTTSMSDTRSETDAAVGRKTLVCVCVYTGRILYGVVFPTPVCRTLASAPRTTPGTSRLRPERPPPPTQRKCLCWRRRCRPFGVRRVCAKARGSLIRLERKPPSEGRATDPVPSASHSAGDLTLRVSRNNFYRPPRPLPGRLEINQYYCLEKPTTTPATLHRRRGSAGPWRFPFQRHIGDGRNG